MTFTIPAELPANPAPPVEGQEWTVEQQRADFETIAFMAPFVEVKHRATGISGSLMFERRGESRIYYGFVAS